ncbi:hypothetical protein C0J52_11393, partial [Blattella germanica]
NLTVKYFLYSYCVIQIKLIAVKSLYRIVYTRPGRKREIHFTSPQDLFVFLPIHYRVSILKAYYRRKLM